MALLACTECGKEISDKASSCPSCGAPSAASPPKRTKRKTSPVAWAALIAIVGGLLWYSQSREYKEQSLPTLPIEVGYRKAITGPGMVLHVKNTSGQPLFALVGLSNPTTKENKSFRVDIPAHGSAELGHKEGWVLASGDSLQLSNVAFKTWKGSIP